MPGINQYDNDQQDGTNGRRPKFISSNLSFSAQSTFSKSRGVRVVSAPLNASARASTIRRTTASEFPSSHPASQSTFVTNSLEPVSEQDVTASVMSDLKLNGPTSARTEFGDESTSCDISLSLSTPNKTKTSKIPQKTPSKPPVWQPASIQPS